MNNSKFSNRDRLSDADLDRLLSESAQHYDVADSSELRERIIQMSHVTPQQSHGFWPQLRMWRSHLSTPMWGAATATAAALLAVFMLYPNPFASTLGAPDQDVVSANPPISARDTELGQGVNLLSSGNVEQLSDDYLWEEILLLEDELAFNSFESSAGF